MSKRIAFMIKCHFYIKTIFFIGLLSFVKIHLYAQNYQLENINVDDGLCQSQVYDMLEDVKGKLWMGTRGAGVCIYDGLKFSSINHAQGLSNNFVFCIRKDIQQNIWIGTSNGLNKYDGNKVSSFYLPNEKDVWIKDMCFDKNGALWIASKIGLLKFENEKFSNISLEMNLPREMYNTVFVNQENKIFYGNDHGVFELIKKQNAYESKKIIFLDKSKIMSVTKIVEDENCNMYIGTYGYGLYRVNENKELERVLMNGISKDEIILDLDIDKKNQLILSTLGKGVCFLNLNKKTVEWISDKKGLSNNHIRCVLEDKNGMYWIGSSGGGVSHFKGNFFSHFTEKNGLNSNYITSILERKNKEVWFGTAQKGVTVMYGDSVVVYNSNNKFQDVKVRTIVEDKNQRIWIGTEGDGLYYFENNTFYTLKNDLPKFIKHIAVNKNNAIWLATLGEGLIKLNYQNQKLNITPFKNGLLQLRINYLYFKDSVTLFYCTENYGIGVLKNEKITSETYTTDNVLSSNSTRNIVINDNNIAYIGTIDKGVNIVDLNRKEALLFDNSKLVSNNIYLIGLNNKKELILGTEKGIDVIKLKTDSEIEEIKHFGKSDGFQGIETNQNAIFQNEDGSTWFGTVLGATLYKPNQYEKKINAPTISIEAIKLFYLPIQKTIYSKLIENWNVFNSIELPYHQNHITFDIIGTNLSNGEAVMYQWKLNGFDSQWNPMSKQNTITYSNLEPGDYSLEVMAMNEDGVWTGEPFSYKFSITSPFWKKQWFYILSALAFALFLFLIYKYRIYQLKKQNEKVKSELQLNNELLDLKHKSLMLQMNPHFIFNALNSLQSHIGTNEDAEAKNFVAKFGKLMRKILNNSQQSFISLQDEIDLIENYILVEKYSSNKNIIYEFKTEDSILKEDIKIPPMILQPFVENSIIHGFRNLKEKIGNLKIDFKIQNQILICTIEDNGIGREHAALLNVNKEHRSYALELTEKRLTLLSNHEISNPVVIEDLFENNKPAGTRVILKIPIL